MLKWVTSSLKVSFLGWPERKPKGTHFGYSIQTLGPENDYVCSFSSRRQKIDLRDSTEDLLRPAQPFCSISAPKGICLAVAAAPEQRPTENGRCRYRSRQGRNGRIPRKNHPTGFLSPGTKAWVRSFPHSLLSKCW